LFYRKEGADSVIAQEKLPFKSVDGGGKRKRFQRNKGGKALWVEGGKEATRAKA